MREQRLVRISLLKGSLLECESEATHSWPLPASEQPPRSAKCSRGNSLPFELQIYFQSIKDVTSWYRFRLLFENANLLKMAVLANKGLHSHVLLSAKTVLMYGHACLHWYIQDTPILPKLIYATESHFQRKSQDKLRGCGRVESVLWDHQVSAGGSEQGSWMPSFLIPWLNVLCLGVPWQMGIITTRLG